MGGDEARAPACWPKPAPARSGWARPCRAAAADARRLARLQALQREHRACRCSPPTMRFTPTLMPARCTMSSPASARARPSSGGRAAAGQCRAPSEAACRNGPPVPRLPGGDRGHAGSSRRASPSRSTICAMNIRMSRCPTGWTPQDWLEHLVMAGGAAPRFPTASRHAICEDRWTKNSRLIRSKALCQLLPDRARHRPLRPQPDPPILCQGRGSARPIRWSATCSASPRSIRWRTTCCSRASFPRSATSRPISTSISSMSGARR